MLLLYILGAIIVLQFSDALAKYAAYNQAISEASGILQWLAGKVGLPAALITTKVVVVAIFVALYIFTKLPWWLWALAAAYYLYSTGHALVLWRSLVSKVTTVVTDVEDDVGGGTPSPTPSPAPAPSPSPTPSDPPASQ